MRRILTLALAATGTAIVAAGGWLGWTVANPATADAANGDAIFVHAGGNGDGCGRRWHCSRMVWLR